MPRNKNIIIVGGTSGLGRRLAERYADAGSKVGIIGRRTELLEEIARKNPESIFVCPANINEESFELQLKDLIRSMNGMDILIVAASIAEFNENLVLETETATVETNVKGWLRVMLAGYHYFTEKGGGQIVGITSIAAARGNKMAPAYNASKAFQSNYLQGLRLRIKFNKVPIKVTELIPGYMQTEMGKGERLFWVAPVDKAARQAQRAIDRKKRRAFITSRWWFIYYLLRSLPSIIYEPLVNGSWKMKHKT